MVKKNWSTVGEVMWLIMAIWKQLLRHNIRSMQSIYYPLSHHHVSPVLRCLLSTQNVLLQPTTRLILPHTSILSLTYTCAPRVISHGVGGRSFHKNSRADDRKRGKRITAKQMLVIDEDGRSLGVMDKRVALRVAEEKALELVQVQKEMPDQEAVCRLISRKQLWQDNKDKNKKDPQSVIKEIKIAVRISDHDLDTKLAQIRQNLEKSHTVQEKLLSVVLERVSDIGVKRNTENWTARRDLLCFLKPTVK